MRKRLAIIGNGMATDRLLDELLNRNAPEMFDIRVYGEEVHGSYNRILLGRILNGGSPEEITLKPIGWYAERGVHFRSGVRVESVDLAARKLTLNNGENEPFEVCVFATGSKALVPPVQGLMSEDGQRRKGVHVFRTMEDGLAIRERARPGSSVVVVGGGLLGLETARALGDLGLHVTVLHLNPVLMNTQLDEFAGDILKKAVEKSGVFVRTGTTVQEVLGNGHVECVRLRSGETVPADLIVFACGVVPRCEVAQASGIPVNRGILVNDLMATARPGIYAVGECAEHAGVVYGLVQPIWEQCAVLADVLTGTNPRSRYTGSRTYAKLKAAGVEVASIGETEPAFPTDEVVRVFEDRRGIYRKLIVRGGKLAGAMLVGCTESAASLVQIFDRNEELPPNRIDILASNSALPSADRMVCNCNLVTESTVVSAIRNGCTALPTLCESTRAGTGCGSCKGQLSALLSTHSSLSG